MSRESDQTGPHSDQYELGKQAGSNYAEAQIAAWLRVRGRYFQKRGRECNDFWKVSFVDHGDVLVELGDQIERGEHRRDA